MNSQDILNRTLNNVTLTRQEIVHLLSLSDSNDIEDLFKAADQMREKYVGDEIFLRGIVEFSNYCRNDCLYCGLRASNQNIVRYRIPDDEIIALAGKIREMECTTIVLQSGEDPFYNAKRLAVIIRRIKQETGLAITLSVGERSYEDYYAFKRAGADRYLLRHETASKKLYNSLHPGLSLDDRIQCLRWLKELGYETGAGCMVGLPGQGIEDLADDIILMKKLDIDMIGIGPFIPHQQTPLTGQTTGDIDMVLKMLAVARLVTKDTNIPSTTAIGVIDSEARKKAFFAGANVFMPNFTPPQYSEHYTIYPNKDRSCDRIKDVMDRYAVFFKDNGRIIGRGYGYRQKGRM